LLSVLLFVGFADSVKRYPRIKYGAAFFPPEPDWFWRAWIALHLVAGLVLLAMGVWLLCRRR
jgi:hypothetical protein